jgi:hypothetical protein
MSGQIEFDRKLSVLSACSDHAKFTRCNAWFFSGSEGRGINAQDSVNFAAILRKGAAVAAMIESSPSKRPGCDGTSTGEARLVNGHSAGGSIRLAGV